ncbi:Ig-like domain-containing protein, partial [Curtobacterium citreum]
MSSLDSLRTVTALGAQVTKVNNIAQSAVVSGTATPGAKVSVGQQEVTANSANGTWSMTVTGLAVGKNDLVVIQKINGTEHDRKTVSPTIIENGGFFGVDQGPIELERGESTQVPFVVENRESRTDAKGTVVLTAPDGTTFSEQDTVQGSWRRVGNTAWNASTSIPLTNGRLSNDNTTLTFDADWASERPADQQYRFMVGVTAGDEAPVGSSSMDFDFSGTSSKGDFRAQGKTTTTVADNEVPAPDALVVTTPRDGSTVDTNRPVFSGTGDEGATIEIRDQDDQLIATTTVEDGAWSVPASADLADGSYDVTVTQNPVTGAPSSVDVSFTVAANPLTTDLTAVGAFDEDDVTKPATISGDATTGAIVVVKDSLGNEVGSIEAVDGKYSIPVPPSFAHTGVNDFTVTQTKGGSTSPEKEVSLDYGMPTPIRITSPENGSTVQKQGLTFTGTGDNGARIDVRGSVRAIATGTVTDGTWNAPVTIDLSNNVYELRAVQTTKGGLTTQAPITITIRDEAPVAPLTATAAFNAT